MKKITLILSVIFLVGCSGQSENIDSQSFDKNETFNWRLVTSWPKNYPGLGICLLYTSDAAAE